MKTIVYVNDEKFDSINDAADYLTRLANRGAAALGGYRTRSQIVKALQNRVETINRLDIFYKEIGKVPDAKQKKIVYAWVDAEMEKVMNEYDRRASNTASRIRRRDPERAEAFLRKYYAILKNFDENIQEIGDTIKRRFEYTYMALRGELRDTEEGEEMLNGHRENFAYFYKLALEDAIKKFG